MKEAYSFFDGNVDFDFGNITYRADIINKACYAHFNVGQGQATIAGMIVNDVLYYGVSFCSPEDNFSKKLGRRKAEEHFIYSANKRGVLRGDFKSSHPSEVLEQALKHYLGSNRRLPKWIRGDVSLRGRFRGRRCCNGNCCGRCSY